MKSLQERLEASGVKASYQRLKILKFLEGNRTHPTAEMIYEQLVKEVPTISRTTIYNSLALFKEKGLIADLTISGSDVRYDVETRPHSHFLCRKCGRVFDLEGVSCPHLKRELEGHMIDEVHLYFKGVCKNCRKRR